MKHMTMPDVKIVRFETIDIVTTSGEPNTITNEYDQNAPTLAPGRNSLWD